MLSVVHIEGKAHIHVPKAMDIPKGKRFKLLKSLYGLHSHLEINKALMGLHFQLTVSDSCLYFRRVRGKLHLILVYVDVILIASEDEDYISGIKKGICAEYDMTS
jgi:hypothetical protein